MRNRALNILFSALTVLLIAVAGLYVWLVAFDTPTADLPPADIAARIETDGLEAGAENTLKRCFGLTGGEIGDYVYYNSSDIMNVDELLIVRVRDDAALERLENAVERRLASQKQAFAGYGVTRLATLENAVTVIRGNYFFYAVSQNADQWKAAFLSALKGT